MKRLLSAVLLSFIFLLISCRIYEQTFGPPIVEEYWLCSINADGSGLRKIAMTKNSFGISGLKDIYITIDEKIIFYGTSLWMSDTDRINPVRITPADLVLSPLPRLSQSTEGSKLYFAASNNIYRITYPDFYLEAILLADGDHFFRNPVVSSQDQVVTFVTEQFERYVSFLDLSDKELRFFPGLGSNISSVVYRHIDNSLYFDSLTGGLSRTSLGNDDISVVDEAGSRTPQRFSLTTDERYLVRAINHNQLRINDLVENTVINIPINSLSPYTVYCSTAKTRNRLFYVKSDKNLRLYDLDEMTDILLLSSGSGFRFDRLLKIASNWDGSRVYFFCSYIVD